MKYLGILLSFLIHLNVYGQPDHKIWQTTIQQTYQDTIYFFTPENYHNFLSIEYAGYEFDYQCVNGLVESATEEINGWYTCLYFLWFNPEFSIYPHDIRVFQTVMNNIIDDVMTHTLDSIVYYCME